MPLGMTVPTGYRARSEGHPYSGPMCDYPHDRIGGRYRLVRRLGSGSFGEVYIGVEVLTGAEVAIKLEPIRCSHPQLMHEAKLYKVLAGGLGVPHVYWYGAHGDFNVMVIDLLGPSLEDLLRLCDGRLSLKTVLAITDQMIERVEYLHHLGIIHRDIKPANFLIGRGKMASLLHIIDFGLSKRFRDRKTHKHIPYREGEGFTGTARFASLRTHFSIEQSRRDDLEAICYTAMYLLRGNLPWMDAKGRDRCEQYAIIRDSKVDTPLDVLCPRTEFQEYMYYCRCLEFEQRPDYSYLRRLLKEAFFAEGFKNDLVYDWTIAQVCHIPKGVARGTDVDRPDSDDRRVLENPAAQQGSSIPSKAPSGGARKDPKSLKKLIVFQ